MFGTNANFFVIPVSSFRLRFTRMKQNDGHQDPDLPFFYFLFKRITFLYLYVFHLFGNSRTENTFQHFSSLCPVFLLFPRFIFGGWEGFLTDFFFAFDLLLDFLLLLPKKTSFIEINKKKKKIGERGENFFAFFFEFFFFFKYPRLRSKGLEFPSASLLAFNMNRKNVSIKIVSFKVSFFFFFFFCIQ